MESRKMSNGAMQCLVGKSDTGLGAGRQAAWGQAGLWAKPSWEPSLGQVTEPHVQNGVTGPTSKGL